MAQAKGPFRRVLKDYTPNDGKRGPFRYVWESMHPASIGARAVNHAIADIGYREGPRSNETKYGKQWDQDFVAWCGMAVATWWKKAGFVIPRELALKIDYVPELISLATQKKYRLSLVHKNRVRKGDAVCYDFPTADGIADHVGLFEKWIDKKAGTFYAIEGNTSVAGSQSSGGEVLRRRRSTDNVIAFVRKLPGQSRTAAA